METTRIVDVREIYRVDINDEALKIANAKSIKVFRTDLFRDPISLPSESINPVIALEVIEHLLNPDHMLREVDRVSRKGGSLSVITLNLANWVNRIIVLLGYQPYNAGVSTEILAGIPWKA